MDKEEKKIVSRLVIEKQNCFTQKSSKKNINYNFFFQQKHGTQRFYNNNDFYKKKLQ